MLMNSRDDRKTQQIKGLVFVIALNVFLGCAISFFLKAMDFGFIEYAMLFSFIAMVVVFSKESWDIFTGTWPSFIIGLIIEMIVNRQASQSNSSKIQDTVIETVVVKGVSSSQLYATVAIVIVICVSFCCYKQSERQ